MGFYKQVYTVAAFDFYDTTQIIENVLGTESTKAFRNSFGAIGLSSLYVLNNLGTMLFLYLAYLLLIILKLTISLCRR